MIIENTIKLGFGSILVGCENGIVTIRHVEPPKEIGDEVEPSELSSLVVIKQINFHANIDMASFLKKLDGVSKDNPTVIFRDWIFDFSNYNPKSIDSVRPAFKTSLRSYMFALAC